MGPAAPQSSSCFKLIQDLSHLSSAFIASCSLLLPWRLRALKPAVIAGAAEDAKVFQKHGVNRATTTGVLENVRMVIETAMVDGLVGSGQVLRTLAQKQAFLVQLHPRDRMRLLAVVSASLIADAPNLGSCSVRNAGVVAPLPGKRAEHLGQTNARSSIGYAIQTSVQN